MSLSDEERRSIAALRLENARETLKDARLLQQRGSVRSALNRAYYAMFYAASALAVTRGKAYSKHAGVLGFIHKECVRMGQLDRRHGRAFQKAFEDRSESDYQDFLKLTATDAAEGIASAKEFIAALEKLVAVEPSAPEDDGR